MSYKPCFEPRPYYTESPEYTPEHRAVYHMDVACPDGKRIEKKHRQFFGAFRKQPCKKCEAFQQAAHEGLTNGVGR
jgi:hypothetical protein